MTLGGQAGVDLVDASGPGQTEVEYLDGRLVSGSREHQVARLDVAVDESLLVGVLQTESRLVSKLAGVSDRQRSLGSDQF